MRRYNQHKESRTVSTKQHKNYSAEFKAKVALEALKENKTIPELAAQYGIHPNNVRNWKQEFLENASAVFDRRKEAKHAQEQLKDKEREIEELYKEVGQLTLKVNWAKKKYAELNVPWQD